MCSVKETVLVSQTLYTMPLVGEEERGKNKEKNITKQVLQNILRSRLPVSASSTIVCELKKKNYSKQNNTNYCAINMSINTHYYI